MRVIYLPSIRITHRDEHGNIKVKNKNEPTNAHANEPYIETCMC